jgi:hypothetical protein
VAVSVGAWAAYSSAREPAYPVVDRTAKTSRAASNDVPPAAMSVAASPDTLSKSDRLDAGHQRVAAKPQMTPVTYAPPTDTKQPAAPVAAAPKIVSRHWHDPHDPKFRRERSANQETNSSQSSSSKSKSAKSTTSGPDRRLQANAACKQPSGWNTLRRALNMPSTGC